MTDQIQTQRPPAAIRSAIGHRREEPAHTAAPRRNPPTVAAIGAAAVSFTIGFVLARRAARAG